MEMSQQIDRAFNAGKKETLKELLEEFDKTSYAYSKIKEKLDEEKSS